MRNPWVVMFVLLGVYGVWWIIDPELWGPLLMFAGLTVWVNLFFWGLNRIATKS